MHRAYYVLFVVLQTMELTDEATEAQRGLSCWGHKVTEPGGMWIHATFPLFHFSGSLRKDALPVSCFLFLY